MADTRRLPPAVTASWDWQRRGACRDVDSSVFFHPDDERGSARATRDQLAIRICRHCPVIDSCRHHAIAAGERYGVWGGLSEDDRRAIRVTDVNRG